jgi:AcrR family transcriptional regulator
MPRKADEQLEGRILNAAYRLWSKGGEEAVTMRAVARAAGTTTPTLYERFKDKHELLTFLQDRARERLFLYIKSAASAFEACRRGLEFMVAHENEHRLLIAHWAARLARKEWRPSYEFLMTLLARDLGGSPEDYEELAMALVALVYGAAAHLVEGEIEEKICSQFRRACLAACDELIESAKRKSSQSGKRQKVSALS